MNFINQQLSNHEIVNSPLLFAGKSPPTSKQDRFPEVKSPMLHCLQPGFGALSKSLDPQEAWAQGPTVMLETWWKNDNMQQEWLVMVDIV